MEQVPLFATKGKKTPGRAMWALPILDPSFAAKTAALSG
jgi:hypothetical protein